MKHWEWMASGLISMLATIGMICFGMITDPSTALIFSLCGWILVNQFIDSNDRS